MYPLPFFMTGKQKHIFTAKRRILAAKVLSRKVGYLRTQVFPPDYFESLPTQSFNAHKVIRPDNELFVVQKGVVEIWQRHHDILVAQLGPESIFGDMSLLGQTMLGCKAIAGPGGVTLEVVDIEQANRWIDSNPRTIIGLLGPRLAHVEAEHYRVAFQTVDLRLARLLLELAGAEPTITGLTQDEIAIQIGTYRETVTNALHDMKEDRIIEIGRKRITILDKKALKELSEL
jgi:CRP/FNR family transcriptional regulator, cyclic AMP receptor protein